MNLTSQSALTVLMGAFLLAVAAYLTRVEDQYFTKLDR